MWKNQIISRTAKPFLGAFMVLAFLGGAIRAQAQIALKKSDTGGFEEECMKQMEESMARQGLFKVDIKLPRALIFSMHKSKISLSNLDPNIDKKRLPFFAPKGVTNIALNKPVTASDEEPIIGDLGMITDGDKRAGDGCFVELGPGTQWAQIDLGKKMDIFGVLVWHYHQQARAYKDVIVKISDDPDFLESKTIFNNDDDNSSGQGIGKVDRTWIETNEGRLIYPEKVPVQCRYVRLYSRGNTTNETNNYVEVEVYGKDMEAR